MLAEADPSVSGVNSVDEEGWGPLHSAASCGHTEIVEILISRGEEFRMFITSMDFINVIIFRPKRKFNSSWTGADVNLKNDGGRTSLHYAASKGWIKIAELLILHKAKINAKDKACNFMPEHFICWRTLGCIFTLKMLLKKKLRTTLKNIYLLLQEQILFGNSILIRRRRGRK